MDADETAVEDALHSHITANGADDFELTAFDPETPSATGRVVPDPDGTMQLHDRLEAFLGGVFTEVFDTGVMGVETQCSRDGNDGCIFVVERQE
jgi:hypothetical protein